MRRIAGILGLGLFVITPLHADPPSRVGRVSFLQGSVSFRPGDVDDWTDASLNYPLTSGDHLWTDDASRTEIQAGSQVIRMAPFTAISLLELSDHTLQLRMTQGSIDLRVRQLESEDQVEVDLPNGTVSVLEPGSYRIDVDSSGDSTSITVREGRLDVTAGDQSYTLDRDQSSTVEGGDNPSYDLSSVPPEDEWERWCDSRDRRMESAQSVRYVSNDAIGYDDLDGNGEWGNDPDYGSVWYPRVAVGWAPYHAGRWVWVDPWGWTWLDEAPWGFAPFHYGRWAWFRNRWGWVPGPVVRHPVYAPALVAFVGVGGPGWNVSLGIGNGVAWFPLGPREVYLPAYHASPGYARRVNVTTINVTNVNVTNINVNEVKYVNRNVPGAVTAVDRETFTHARPVPHSAERIPVERIGSAPVLGAAPPVAPERTSVLGHEGTTTARRPPAGVESRQVVAHRTPPAVPVPFESRKQLLDATPGRPLDPGALTTLRRTAPERPTTQAPVRVVTTSAAISRPTTEPGTAGAGGSAGDTRPRAATPRRPAEGTRPTGQSARPGGETPDHATVEHRPNIVTERPTPNGVRRPPAGQGPQSSSAAERTPSPRPAGSVTPATEETWRQLQDRQLRERNDLNHRHQSELTRPSDGNSPELRQRQQKENQDMERRQADERQRFKGPREGKARNQK